MKDIINKYLTATKKAQILIGILVILIGACIAFIPVIGVPIYLIMFWIGAASIVCGIIQRKTDDNASVQERYPTMNGITKKWWFWFTVVIAAITVIGSFGSMGDIMPADSATPTATLITPVPTLVATPQITMTPELSPTSTPNPTVSETPEPTPTATKTPEPTSTPTPSPTKTATPTNTPKPSPTKTPLTVGDLSRDQWEGKYVGSTESNKYHTPSCTHAKKILIVNAIWWDSVEEAKQAGYEPCGTCQD